MSLPQSLPPVTDLDLDETHSPTLKSWVESSLNAGDFPLQNLPLGVFRKGTARPHIGTAIGQSVLDLERTVSVGALGWPQRSTSCSPSAVRRSAAFGMRSIPCCAQTPRCRVLPRNA